MGLTLRFFKIFVKVAKIDREINASRENGDSVGENGGVHNKKGGFGIAKKFTKWGGRNKMELVVKKIEKRKNAYWDAIQRLQQYKGLNETKSKTNLEKQQYS